MPTKRELEALRKAQEKKTLKAKKRGYKKVEPKVKEKAEKKEIEPRKPKNYEIPKATRGQGAPSLLTQEKMEKIAAAIAGGASQASAAKSVRVTPETFGIWIRKGKEKVEPYLTFFECIEDAKARYEESINKVSESAIKLISEKILAGDVKLGQWWLERVRSDVFGSAKVVNNQVVTQDSKVAVSNESKLVLTKEQVESLGKEGLEKIVGKEMSLFSLIDTK